MPQHGLLNRSLMSLARLVMCADATLLSFLPVGALREYPGKTLSVWEQRPSSSERSAVLEGSIDLIPVMSRAMTMKFLSTLLSSERFPIGDQQLQPQAHLEHPKW